MPRMKLNDTEIYYEDHGPQEAPAIVLSSFLYLDTKVYEPLVTALAEEYRVITYDHRGQGQSWHASKKTDLLATTRDAIALIENLEIEPCHFVGSGLGAYVGLNLAVQRSDLLKSCTLLGAIAEAETAQATKDMDRFLESMKKGGARSGMTVFINSHFGDSFRNSKDPQVVTRRDTIMDSLLNLPPEQLENARQIYHRQTLSKNELQKITVPVLIVAGEEDQPSNIAAYKRLSQAIPHVNYKTVLHAGYSVAIEQPQAVISLLYDHIEKAEREFSARLSRQANEKIKVKEKKLRH
ncbi:MAG: alpha/beta fold hydrolase [Pseudobdellovibrionaceae bacterium]